MKANSILLPLVLAVAISVQAQEKKGIVAFGGGVDGRASARVLYWNQQTNSPAGQFAINYGRPLWKKDYDDPAKLDSLTKGKVWRMGKNFWTVLDTQLPLKISSMEVGVGYYYLGLHRSADGATWSLAFFDPAKIRHERIDAFEIARASPQFLVPVSVERSETTTEELTITLKPAKDDMRNVTLRMVWGSMLVTAPIQVALSE